MLVGCLLQVFTTVWCFELETTKNDNDNNNNDNNNSSNNNNSNNNNTKTRREVVGTDRKSSSSQLSRTLRATGQWFASPHNSLEHFILL
ncbi:unnamed protein product [Polarella glacialis]|uniref:Uncharacterized protein n=1 Tax=Polarella glacialis TaxID=89957 RepID=A0A813IWU8_POLGL|nr:unnamed protein product [Polarella glacialis]